MANETVKHAEVGSWNEAFDLCRERNTPLLVWNANSSSRWQIFPSGAISSMSPSGTVHVTITRKAEGDA